MLPGYSPVAQAFMGTMMTWALTAAGSALAMVIKGSQRVVLDVSLGFAAGVMLAASYWSLLEPGIEMAEQSGSYGANGEYAFVPAAVGFFLGGGFVYAADLVMDWMGVQSPVDMVLRSRLDESKVSSRASSPASGESPQHVGGSGSSGALVRRRHRKASCDSAEEGITIGDLADTSESRLNDDHWRRILLLIVAITVHNIPEGLAVGVGFGAVGRTKSATFENARNLALGIGIQNFPEGLAVSMPLKAAGFSTMRSIWYGQLSGLVEPVAGVLGALLVSVVVPILPYSLAFAAGAMVYVVVDDIIPEAQSQGNGKLASWGCIAGFIVMMCLDVGLG